MKTNPTDPAFNGTPGSGCPGLTKREYFAAMAMQGMIGRDSYDAGQATPQQRAHLAVIEADALIAELNK